MTNDAGRRGNDAGSAGGSMKKRRPDVEFLYSLGLNEHDPDTQTIVKHLTGLLTPSEEVDLLDREAGPTSAPATAPSPAPSPSSSPTVAASTPSTATPAR